MKRILRNLACGAGLAWLAGCAGDVPPQVLAPQVDLARYAGHWNIIANIPYFAERGKVGSYFDISFPDGKVRDLYYGRDGRFDAPLTKFTMNGYVVPDSGNARWREGYDTSLFRRVPQMPEQIGKPGFQ
jgi:apolipoprotein D and lipocalin family protein